eukprot:jgi/Chrzof1/147/Cz01g05040.t1
MTGCVCCQIIDDVKSLKLNPAGKPLEAALTKDLHHLGVMRTITYTYSDVGCSSGGAQSAPKCWMLFENCNKGCLGDAVVKGWFRTNRSPTQGVTDIHVVALTALEIASAMEYLHDRNVLHGDLSGGNIMLTSSSINPHGFTAKVGDFGLARDVSPQAKLKDNNYGTVTHMPPEVLLDGHISQAMDVYAFGVLLWEMCTGSRAWAGLHHAAIICQVACLKRGLQLPDGLPAELRRLLGTCLAPDPVSRPTFKQIRINLEHFVQSTRGVDFTTMLVGAETGNHQQAAGNGRQVVHESAVSM